ncbi:ribose 5-phosphate isomerase A [Paenibacillus peoriae]|uniref:ribose 5-phosphate isomerase A n=1 Tax=Paenibacillus peoriae TaxID=59893 RepID=UPI00026C6796|nr:ribose 5-phosphate isomerase A [Paenibacillus peoriae]MEC0180892.1 ribose 5-phosphate isomerase A [Paenibacillus peoriae]
MDADELRRRCAQETMKHIHNKDIIGLGAGRNIACLINHLSEEIRKGLMVSVVTPSLNTKELCLNKGIEVIETYVVDEIDIAFDGCGEVDQNFYASKSGGGIHTKEKLIAAMSREYILLIDEGKLSDSLSCKYPVSLEIIKDSLSYVTRCVEKVGGAPVVRKSSNKDGYTITDDGNYLIDVKFSEVPDWKSLNDYLNSINGVVGTSLFTKEITKLIVANEHGARVISRQ